MHVLCGQVIAQMIENKFNQFCCGCKIYNQDCLMKDEFEKWEMYGLDAIQNAAQTVWEKFIRIIEILNIPYQNEFGEYLLQMKQKSDLLLVESLFQETIDNPTLVYVLNEMENPLGSFTLSNTSKDYIEKQITKSL
jgi:hypothetical protein